MIWYHYLNRTKHNCVLMSPL